MTKTGSGVGELARLLPRAVVVALVMWLPLMAMESVRAGDENIIVDTQELSSGAGFVLMISLQRAR